MPSFNYDRVIGVIRSSTEDVFATMLNLPLEAGQPSCESTQSNTVDGIIALVGLAGSWVGSGRVSCSASFACKISGALLASEYDAVNEDVLDAMAEVTNMIIGNVKSALEEELGPMGLSIPTVIFGRNYQARSSGVTEWIVMPFRSGENRLDVKFCLVPAGDSLRVREDLALNGAM